jgi:hypothetical protein
MHGQQNIKLGGVLNEPGISLGKVRVKMEAPGSLEMFVPMGTVGEQRLHLLGTDPDDHNFNNLLWLQPLQYSDVRTMETNYENHLVNSFYVYIQMILYI